MAIERYLVGCSLTLIAAFAFACGPAKDPSSAIADETIEPSNKAEIERYSDESTIRLEKATIAWKAAPIRRSHPDGRLTAILTQGNAVTKVAHRGEFFLITFPNPIFPSERWSGWAHKNAFVAGTEPSPPLGNPKKCVNDADCGEGAKCNAVASTAARGHEGFRFCAGQ